MLCDEEKTFADIFKTVTHFECFFPKHFPAVYMHIVKYKEYEMNVG